MFGDDKARFSPALSPDGRTLAYVLDGRDEAGAGEIFVTALDGVGRATGTPRQLTSDGVFKLDLTYAARWEAFGSRDHSDQHAPASAVQGDQPRRHWDARVADHDH